MFHLSSKRLLQFWLSSEALQAVKLCPCVKLNLMSMKFVWEDVRGDSLGLNSTRWRRQKPWTQANRKTYTQIKTCCWTLIPHQSTSWVIRTLNHRAETSPLRERGRKGTEAQSAEKFKPVATQTGPLSEPLTDPEQTERRRWENLTTSSFFLLQEHLRDSGGSLINIISWFTLNLLTHWSRNSVLTTLKLRAHMSP